MWVHWTSKRHQFPHCSTSAATHLWWHRQPNLHRLLLAPDTSFREGCRAPKLLDQSGAKMMLCVRNNTSGRCLVCRQIASTNSLSAIYLCWQQGRVQGACGIRSSGEEELPIQVSEPALWQCSWAWYVIGMRCASRAKDVEGVRDLSCVSR